MDMLQVGRGMTYEEDKAHFSMCCLMHSPLLLGNDLTNISEETLGIITNKNLISINQSEFVYQARRLIDYGEMEVWGKPLVSTMSGQVVVALLNRTAEKQAISFNLTELGINPQKKYSTKDLWTNEVSESMCDSILSYQVPAHGVVVLKLSGSSLPYNVYQFKDEK